ncbi:MAG TPA: aldo/keto reductase [Abditibacteriaceae bacterium]|jgi:aryl-alcohol dehydrogenase-like predicted oxidoreductase
MQRRVFNGSGVQVSEVGLGTWQIGGSWGNVSEEESLAVLRTAAESGVTFFDTADVYGDGRSESLIGKFLQESSADIFVATKLGRSGTPGGAANFSLDSFRLHTEASLRRLGVEALDLTQLHCIPTEVLQQGEVFDWLRTLQKEGKIRHFGASVESMDEALLCLQQDGLASLQIIFNIFRQKPISALFEAAQAKGVALIVRLPLASGLLSGKFTKETHFSTDDHRNFNRDGQAFNVGETFAGLPFEKGVELSDGLKALVPPGMTMAQMALRWILDYDAVTTVIPGARNTNQVAANVSASALPPLGEELHAKLRDFYEAQVAAHIRGPY